MKKVKLSLVVLLFFSNQLIAQNVIDLPTPDKTGGKPLMQALNERQSNRDFIDKDLTEQQLSDLLWAAYGINRPEDNKHTTPTSRNKQDIEIYLTSKDGVFLYIPETHTLKQINDQDLRKVSGKQAFVKKAAVNLIYVSDFNKLGKGDDQTKMVTAATHCGFIGQNVYLYCASEGLITVFRAWIDKQEIREALQLKENQKVIYSQTVGYSE
ncbi:MAG: SagB/ThcOx family dehydrogenase [Bacteroidetes bacterium]|nr:SagB/ThcOx family dehydrogenase [Bacteroidota bacterium]